MKRIDGHNGFTLIELIVGLMIISILAATVVLRVGIKTENDALIHADQLRRDLSHAQMLAISWSTPLRFSISAGGASYLVCLTTSATCTSSTDAVIDPATGDRFQVDMPNGVVLVSSGGTSVDFDSLGRPISGSNLITSNPARTYTFVGRTPNPVVTLQPVTGFAQLSY